MLVCVIGGSWFATMRAVFVPHKIYFITFLACCVMLFFSHFVLFYFPEGMSLATCIHIHSNDDCYCYNNCDNNPFHSTLSIFTPPKLSSTCEWKLAYKTVVYLWGREEVEMRAKYVNVSIHKDLAKEIDRYMKTVKKGYRSGAEVVSDAIRRLIEEK